MGPPIGKDGYWSQRRYRGRQLGVVTRQSCSRSTHCLGDTWLPAMNEEFIWFQLPWSSEPQQCWRNESSHAAMATCFPFHSAQPRPGMQQVLKKYFLNEQTNRQPLELCIGPLRFQTPLKTKTSLPPPESLPKPRY